MLGEEVVELGVRIFFGYCGFDVFFVGFFRFGLRIGELNGVSGSGISSWICVRVVMCCSLVVWCSFMRMCMLLVIFIIIGWLRVWFWCCCLLRVLFFLIL